MLRAPVLRPQIALERLWSWPLIWSIALTRPTVATYHELLRQPAPLTAAYSWLLVAAAASGLLPAIVAGGGQSGDYSLLLAVPLYSLLAFGSWIIFAGCTQWLAQRCGGQGTYQELLYTFATFSAPLSIITALLSLLPWSGLATFCLYGYWFFLYMLAVQAVQRFTWRRAAGVLLLAVGLLFVITLSLLVGLGYVLL